MCCAKTSKVNTVQVAVTYQFCKVDIGMSVFYDDIAAAGTQITSGKEYRIVDISRLKRNYMRIKEN